MHKNLLYEQTISTNPNERIAFLLSSVNFTLWTFPLFALHSLHLPNSAGLSNFHFPTAQFYLQFSGYGQFGTEQVKISTYIAKLHYENTSPKELKHWVKLENFCSNRWKYCT